MIGRPDRSVHLVAAVAALLLVAGCAGGSNDSEEPAPAAVDELLTKVEQTRPGVVLQAFARAAARGDERLMWERLSAPSKRRLGPTLARFRLGAASLIQLELRSIGRRPELTLSQTIAPPFAVAAVERQSAVYASALRLERGLWRIELGSPVQLKPLRPKPGETVARRTQLAADVRAGTPLIEAGLWLDGAAFPSRGGGPTANAMTMFGETPRLSSGPHTVVAFASTIANATARAWAFRAAVR
jgi:hypothetical protein